MWSSILNGPYKRPMIPNPDDTEKQILEPLSNMTITNKSQYNADVKVMNYLLQAIPNDIYNSLDACKNAKEIWQRIKRLMFGSDVTSHVRHSRLIDEFDKFATKEGESLESVYERLTMLVNIVDRNNVCPIPVSINTKFLNLQFEPHGLASKAKKAAKNHDPLALLIQSNASASQSHANSSYSPQPYYVTHPSSVVDYEDEYQRELQGDSQEDKLTTAMMNQAVILDGRVDIQTKNAGYGGNGNKNAGRQNRNQAFNAGTGNNESSQIVQRVSRTESTPRKANVQEQMLLAMKDEAGSNLNNEENDFMLDTSYGEETMEELTAAVMLMAQIQPADGNAETVTSYDAKAVSEVNASSKVHEQVSHVKHKTIIQTSDDDQIDSNIIFDDPYVKHNGGTSDYDSNAHDEYHEIQMLAYNNPERLKKAITAQPKMYVGEKLHSARLTIDSPDSEETLEDAEKSRLKMRNKMKNKLLKVKLEKSSSDSKDIQANLQGDSQEDKLTTAKMLLARAITVQDGRQNRNQEFNARNRNGDNNQIVQHVPRTESTPGKANVHNLMAGSEDDIPPPTSQTLTQQSSSDSDYAGANLDRKSTIGGCQFLGRRLIYWQCKKHTIVATSTIEAEYVAAANCCGQVLWIQNQMLDYGFNFMNTKIYIDNESTICIVKNLVFHSKTKHIAIRHHFIKDAYEKKLIQVLKIHTDDNVADLLTKAFDVSRFQFLVVTIGMINP
ncbi:hypothetical protein Tco_0157640 [Tanacetum coccineum]